jgi:hypothetical protein
VCVNPCRSCSFRFCSHARADPNQADGRAGRRRRRVPEAPARGQARQGGELSVWPPLYSSLTSLTQRCAMACWSRSLLMRVAVCLSLTVAAAAGDGRAQRADVSCWRRRAVQAQRLVSCAHFRRALFFAKSGLIPFVGCLGPDEWFSIRGLQGEDVRRHGFEHAGRGEEAARGHRREIRSVNFCCFVVCVRPLTIADRGAFFG